MPTLQIPNVPEDVHSRIVSLAANRGTSVDAFLRACLAEIADRATIEELLDRAEREARGSFGFAEVIQALDEARAAP